MQIPLVTNFMDYIGHRSRTEEVLTEDRLGHSSRNRVNSMSLGSGRSSSSLDLATFLFCDLGKAPCAVRTHWGNTATVTVPTSHCCWEDSMR